MSNIAYDSGLLDFAADESQFTEVNHALGFKPKVIQFYGDLAGELGFPTLLGTEGEELSGPYLEDVEDLQTLKVFKPDVYNYSGKFRIVIYN